MSRSLSSLPSPVELPSSPDPLANSSESGNTLHSIARPNGRLTSPRKTPLRNGNVNSQIIPSSPQRAYFAANSPSKAITEQTLSPWKIRVTVEAEPEDGIGTPQYSTQTYQVPLKSCSSPTKPITARGRGRAGQSSPVRKKRSGTPVRGTATRRKSVTNLDITVLGDDEDEDEWSPQKKSQVKKHGHRRSKPTKQTEPSSPELAQSIEEDADMYGPGTSISHSISPKPAQQVEGDIIMHGGVSPPSSSQSSTTELREIDTNRVSVRPRSHSAKRIDSEIHQEERQKDLAWNLSGSQKSKARDFSNTSAVSYPTPSPTPSAPAEEEFDEDEGVGYDTVMESEGFTMIDLESIPSAKRFLSSPHELTDHLPSQQLETDVSSSTKETEPLQAKIPTPMPIHVTSVADETVLSSNVASSPPQATDVLHIQRPLMHRKVTPNPYASPELPPPPTQTKKPTSTNADILPPRRVVNAGKALYGALSNSDRDRLDQEQPPSAGSGNFLDGFSSGTKRELRAHLRLGEELAKKGSNSNPQSQRSGLTEPSDQVWRGEALVQRSSFTLNAHSQTKGAQDANDDCARLLGPSLSPGRYKDSGCLDEKSAQKQIVTERKTVRKPTESKTSQDTRSEHERQKGREDSVQHHPLLYKGEPLLDESTDDASEEDERDAGHPYGARADIEENIPGEKSSADHWGLDEERGMAAQAISATCTDVRAANERAAEREPEDGSAGDETDIWLVEARESSSSPTVAAKERREILAKPRRRLIPSPWKRGEDVAEASTMLSNGDVSGMLWQQPQDTRFGAGELARQTKRVSSHKFDLQRMLSSPVKVAAVGRNNLKFRTQHGQVSSPSSSAVDSSISEDSAQSALEEDASSLSQEGHSHTDSSIPSSPPQPESIPFKLDDFVTDAQDVTPPPLARSSPTERDQLRPPTPRSAMKGARGDISPVKQVVFNDRSRYLNELGEESTMSANLDSPAPTPAQPYRAPAPSETSSEESLRETTPQANSAKRGWGAWFLRGQNGSSDGRSESASDESQAQSSIVSGSSSIDPPSNASHPQTPVDDECGADWMETRVGTHAGQARPVERPSVTTSKGKKVSLPRLPSYLQSPSWPSLKPTDPTYTAHPLATSGDFTNAHFRTLHILHAKSIRPRFHAPKHVRPEIQSLRGMKLTVDESEADMDVFEWTVGMEECLVIERFMQEVEWGWVQSWHSGQAEEALRAKMKNQNHGGERDSDPTASFWTGEMRKVGWGWTPEEIARHLGMVVIGEVVRSEEREREQ